MKSLILDQKLSDAIKAACQDNELFKLLRDCGPFDGGCLMVAEALRQVLGQGDLYGAYGRYVGTSAIPDWGHALLRIGDLYLDGNGIQREQEVQNYFLDKENYVIIFFIRMKNPQGHYGTTWDPDRLPLFVDYFRRQLGPLL